MTDPSNRFALAQSCDGDAIIRYTFDLSTGELCSDGLTPTAVLPKSGPRHIQFHPNNKSIYLVNDYDASVIVYGWNSKKGSLHEIQTASAVPTGDAVDKDTQINWRAADLHLTPDGSWLYVSTRTKSNLVAFRVDPVTGLVMGKGQYATASEPRSFASDPSAQYIFASGFNEESLAAFRIDSESGDHANEGL